MERKIELLAPGGDVDAIKAAILAGANAIYCGLDKFNARNRAANISFDDLQGILRLAHYHGCEVFITLNIIIVENEIPALINLLNKLANTSIDGVIVQDLGMLYLLKKYFKNFDVHASTQMTTHNRGQIKFLSKLDVSRVNLSRELNIHEIKELSAFGKKHHVSTEVFVHGSNCISFSGICYMSSLHGGNSGNRGRCSQPCRDKYEKTEADKDYPLNLKDNSAFSDIKELYEAGVYSLKIEGRIKKADYVYTVVNTWRNNIQALSYQSQMCVDQTNLYKVFNRDFSNTYLKGDINKEMFIDNPRDYSVKHLCENKPDISLDELEKMHLSFYKEKDDMKAFVEKQVRSICATKGNLNIDVSGKRGDYLKLVIKTDDSSFEIYSETKLVKNASQSLNEAMLLKRLKALNETEYHLNKLDLTNLDSDLFISFNELTAIKKELLFVLNGNKMTIDPVSIPNLKSDTPKDIKPNLSVFISSEEDVKFCEDSNATLYFQLPNCFKTEKYLKLFRDNQALIPYFPSVIMGEAYSEAVLFLNELQPKQIVSNNLGIAYEANILGIDWIAGPQLNITNSYSLLCLKEELNCKGAFISNELNRNQIKQIKCPDHFDLYYSIYHPIVLMTSRQCLFHQVTGCEKNRVDATCIQNCEKLSTITNLKKKSFLIEKSPGNYHNVYNDHNFLNTKIIKDIPHTFSNFSVDLRDIKTGIDLEANKSAWIQIFNRTLEGDEKAEDEIHALGRAITAVQYQKGI